MNEMDDLADAGREMRSIMALAVVEETARRRHASRYISLNGKIEGKQIIPKTTRAPI